MKSAYFGCVPWEHDGGAVVLYYQLLEMHRLDPTHEFFLIPKVLEELDKRVFPFAKFITGWKKMEHLALIMKELEIKILWSFHIAQNLDPLIEPIHEIGGKVINWQTIHWATDRIFTMDHIRDVDHWVAPTHFARNTLIQVGNISPEKITVIPHGIKLDSFYPENHEENVFRKENGIKPETKVILFSGRLDLWKGIQNLIPIIRELTTKYDCAFVIKGTPDKGNDKSRGLDLIFTTIHQRNPRLVYIPYWLNPEEMEVVMRGADIILSPTGHEGFNVPLGEGMACGKPVFTTALANHKEIVGKAGLLFKPIEQVGICDAVQPIRVLTTQQLYEGLKYLLENPRLCEEMGTIGRERAEKLFSLETVSKSWLELLEKINQ